MQTNLGLYYLRNSKFSHIKELVMFLTVLKYSTASKILDLVPVLLHCIPNTHMYTRGRKHVHGFEVEEKYVAQLSFLHASTTVLMMNVPYLIYLDTMRLAVVFHNSIEIWV